ncbi:MAG TPA: SEL1-like repeat protein, partial [Kofleriaceae bacterium]
MRPGIGVLLVLVGCGSGTAAKAVRDDVPKAERAITAAPCLAGQEAQPWTFDMDNTTRGALFSAMRDGLVVVSFDCKELKVMTRCDARGDYRYGAYPVAFDVLDFKDTDELKASISGGALIAAKFEAEMKRGAKLFIAHGEVGMSTTTVPELGRDQIKGPKACDQATHYVTEVHFGAYQMKASSEADVKAAGDIFGKGGSGASASSADSTHRSGNPKACEKGGDNDAAPEGCNTVVRVTLAPIAAAGEGIPAEATPARAELPRPPPACPPGMERIGMVCRRANTTAAAPRPRSCRPGDAEDCAKQCDAGEALSCAFAGTIYERGTGVKPNPQTAFKYYQQACKAG